MRAGRRSSHVLPESSIAASIRTPYLGPRAPGAVQPVVLHLRTRTWFKPLSSAA